MLSLAVWSKLHGAMKHAVLGLCFSNAFLMTMLRLKSDQTFGGVLLTLTILTALGSMSALISAGKYSWAGGALCAAFTILLGFQHALYLLQVQELVPAPVASLCFTLVAGCVRFAFTIICAEDEVYCITKAEIGETEEIEEAEEEKLPGDKHIESESVGDLALAKESNEESRVGQEVRTDRWSEGENETGDKADLKKTGGTNGFKEEANGLMAWSDDEEEAESSGSESLVEFQRIDPLLSRSASYQAENTSRRELLRYVFHEMRAPLNSICMAVDLMTHHFKGSGTPKSSRLDLETLQIIEEATLTMERTLKDSMTLQKIEEGLLRPQMKIFSVHDLCDDIQDALSSVLQSTSVSLVYNVEAAIPEQIAGDHFRVRHVVAHVLSNAIKFSREGGVVNMKVFLQSLSPAALSPVPEEPPNSARSGGSAFESAAPSLDLAARADEREFVVFTISDSGVGMSCELQESDIFKPFNQLKTDEVTGFRGSGLGLAICKKIVSFLGGSITYSSIEGVGTTFTVMFPLTRLDDDDASSEGADELGAIPLSLTSPRTIKSKAIARAKSFRGEKLLSILYNQSNVFECPTPKLTSSASDNFHSFLDPDESPRMYSPVAPPGAFRNNIPSRMSVAFRNSVKEILIPSFDEGDVQAQSSNSNDRSELDDPPQFQLDLGLHSPLKTWKKAVSPVRKHSTASEPVNISPSRAMSFSMDTAAACSSPTSSFRSDGPSELLEALQRSPPLQAPRELKSEYVTLTEKNVNLHILRTAANESVRVLKHKPGGILKVATSKQELAAVLAACKVLVVDGELFSSCFYPFSSDFMNRFLT